jgi:hypothetical protein
MLPLLSSFEKAIVVTHSQSPCGFRMDESSSFEICDAAHATDQRIFYCSVCCFGYCSACWNQQLPHRRTLRGQPHIKTDLEVARKVKSVLSPSADDETQERLFEADGHTAWFGIDRSNDETLVFRDFGRYADLLDETSKDCVSDTDSTWSLDGFSRETRDRRTPSLVSFVGQTGAGKSTIIRLLIEFNSRAAWKYGAPVVGAPNAEIPASEDVHLYLDPTTAMSLAPILYADCEGLQGGEREPLGAKFKASRAMNSPVTQARYSSERVLSWATSKETKSREFAVSQLYPRLLYTFSDVIVFVLRNPRYERSALFFGPLADCYAG